MSMVLALRATSDENLARLVADPPLIWKLVAPDDPEVYERARATPTLGYIGRLLGRDPSQTSSDDEELTFEEGEGEEVDLDKSWHGIHYLLTGTAWEGDPPQNFLLCGGAEIGDIDVGYGPARALSSSEVRAIATELERVDADTLRERFDPAEMMRLKIYPEMWDRDPKEDDTFSYCSEYFEVLKRFVSMAAERNHGVIVYLC